MAVARCVLSGLRTPVLNDSMHSVVLGSSKALVSACRGMRLFDSSLHPEKPLWQGTYGLCDSVKSILGRLDPEGSDPKTAACQVTLQPG